MRTGFGTRLIERGLTHSFDGTVSLTYPSTGAILTLEAPLTAILGEAA
jgi:two-component sensor histidine kinase